MEQENVLNNSTQETALTGSVDNAVSCKHPAEAFLEKVHGNAASAIRLVQAGSLNTYDYEGLYDDRGLIISDIEKYPDSKAVALISTFNSANVQVDNRLLEYDDEAPAKFYKNFVSEIMHFAVHIKKTGGDAPVQDTAIDVGANIADALKSRYVFPDPFIMGNENESWLVYKLAFNAADEENGSILNRVADALARFGKIDESQFEVCKNFSREFQSVALPGTSYTDASRNVKLTVKFYREPEVAEPLTFETLVGFYGKYKTGIRNRHINRYLTGSYDYADCESWFDGFIGGYVPYIDKDSRKAFVDVMEIGSGQFKAMPIDENLVCYIEDQYRLEGFELTKKVRTFFCSEVEKLAIQAKQQQLVEKSRLRIAACNGNIYFDHCNDSGQVSRINAGGFKVMNKGDEEIRRLHLRPTKESAPGVIPVNQSEKSLEDLLKPYFNVDPISFMLLLVVILCYFMDCPNPFLWFNGQEGSGKTTIAKFIQSIVDPSSSEPCPLPSNQPGLYVNLGNKYLRIFDNLSKINDATSDVLCQAVSGGSSVDRTLYKNNEVRVINFKNCVIFTSISRSIVKKPDLLERTITINTKSFKSYTKTEEDLQAEFERDLPSIMFRIFETLQKALEVLPSVKPPQNIRLAGMARHACAISKAI